MVKKALLLLFLPLLLFSAEGRLTTLYNSLDPQSISQLFAFYHLYPNTPQGERALAAGWELMHRHRKEIKHFEGEVVLPAMEIDSIIALVNKQPFETDIHLDDDQLAMIEALSDHLGNRRLRGYPLWEKERLIAMPSEEIDLARALLLYQFKEEPLKVRQYEATLDLISLQILARLPVGASHDEKIRAINHFIFHEKRFRFPPHSLWAKDIDIYTFLPSVLDSRLGVCLGVSILYLSIAQRLDLPLEIITPPGHIFIRYNSGESILNIETTARGVHLPDKVYLGINTRNLQRRTMKEVIGLAFINQASVFWQKGEHETTIELYEQALPYLPDDPLLKMLLGYNYLFVGRTKEGKKLLQEIRDSPFDHAVAIEVTPADFLDGKVNAEGIKAVFSHVDESRQSILDKQEELRAVLKKYPNFRDGILQLAITYLQLGRGQEAYETLSRYHTLDPTSPVVEYYLTTLCINRFHYLEAWKHLKEAQQLTTQRNHAPHCLKGLNHALRTLFPNPDDLPNLL
ncbi:MAG: hypothetical protein K1060chlam2_00209 [Chlamydiae bacterium]|nr:hypothetical protein [Chlamydiota bacterium]